MSLHTEPTAPPDVETIAGYPVHPAARLLPPPSEEEYKRLRDDIAEHGLRIPITVTLGDDGHVLILDGRSRARACKELGLDIPQLPTTFVNRDALQRYFGRSVGLDDCFRLATIDEERDLVAAVLSLNAARRHLTGDQIIALYLQANAVKLEVEKQAAQAAQKANLKRGAARPEGSTVSPSGKAAAKIAKAIGKSESAVKRVQRVQKDAPEKLADLAAGKVSAAQVLKERKAVKSDVNGVAYLDSRGRRRPKLPLSDRMKRISWGIETGIEVLGGILIDARKQGYRDFPLLIQKATTWRSMLDAVLDLAQREPCPTEADLRAILNPDDDPADNEAEPEPAVPEAPGDPAAGEFKP